MTPAYAAKAAETALTEWVDLLGNGCRAPTTTGCSFSSSSPTPKAPAISWHWAMRPNGSTHAR